MNRLIIDNILTNYNKKRLKAMADCDMKKKEIYDAIPELMETDKNIQLMGIKISKLILSNPEDMESEVNKLKQLLNNLKSQKKDIYLKYSIPDDIMDTEYSCKICNDTGYLPDGKRCKCFNMQIIEELYKISNMKYMMEKENFSTFNIEIFSNALYVGEKLTPRQNMYGILSTCEEFCHNFDKITANLLFLGSTGLGKTFMCNCIAKALIEREKTVLYHTAFNLFEIVENHKFFKQDETETNKINYTMMFDSDLLIIDDLGTEFANSFTNAELFNIINMRLISGKKTVISTNLSFEELIKVYSDRIMSRVFNKFISCKFYGKDLRWEKN